MKISVESNKAEFVKEISKFANSGSSYINESGLFNVKINKALFTPASTGSKKFTLNVTKEGGDVESIINLGVVFKADGTKNVVAYNRLLSLLELFKISGVDTKPTKIKAANGDEIEAEEIKELANKTLIIQVQKEYSKYNDKIYRNLNLMDAFRVSDKANAVELLNNKNIGSRYAWLEEHKDTYFKDKYNGVEKDEVDAYYASKSKTQNDAKIEIDEEEGELPF